MSAKLRLIPTILLAGACVIALAPMARAAETPTTYQERVVGVETGLPTSCSNGIGDASSFAGGAFGTLNGTFSATICHSTLGSTGGTINQGGSFVLSGQGTIVGGVFTGGSIVPVPGATGHFGTFCFENFWVMGGLVSTSGYPGSFAAVLTHYGTWTGTICNVTFATVAGRATITA